MKIEFGKVVSFHYTLIESGQESEELESSDKDQPMLYLHGQHGLLDALQEGLTGLEPGAELSIDVPAVRAYGLRKDNSAHRVPLKHVVGVGKNTRLMPGQIVRLNTPDGERDATVVKAGKFNVDIDTNHPLAGKDLTFRVTIVDVRDASEEELAHGHAHGPGGHSHG